MKRRWLFPDVKKIAARRYLILLLAVLCLFAGVSRVFAEQPTAGDRSTSAPICDAAESENYITKTSGQFLRGFVNLSLCWVELFNQPVVAHREGRSAIAGILPGLGHTLLRGAQGVGEMIICPVPRMEKTGSFPVIAKDCSLGVVGLEER